MSIEFKMLPISQINMHITSLHPSTNTKYTIHIYIYIYMDCPTAPQLNSSWVPGAPWVRISTKCYVLYVRQKPFYFKKYGRSLVDTRISDGNVSSLQSRTYSIVYTYTIIKHMDICIRGTILKFRSPRNKHVTSDIIFL